eukprot:scaffold978_cov164-Amphora_coffeaeformis.AAC.15
MNDAPPPPNNNDQQLPEAEEPVANNPEGGVALVPEEHRIESVDRWLELNGLPAPPDNEDEERWERVQDRARVAEAAAYEQAVHERVFSTKDQQAAAEAQRKTRQLQAWQGRKLRITCQQQQQQQQQPEDKEEKDNQAVLDSIIVDLVPLAECCDLIFALASTWHHYNPYDDDETMRDDGKRKKNKDAPLELNLPEYPLSTVQAFLDIVHHRQSLSDLSDDGMIVDLCHLAHYLQHAALLEETVQILLHSIDTHNCMAMTELADQLHLPRLFEAALSHMMQSVADLEEGECWDDLTPELKQRIGAIQAAIQSSIHDQRSALYFGSLQEYLGKSNTASLARSGNDITNPANTIFETAVFGTAIFAERVYYYKERLAEAMEQQADRPQSAGWMDAQRKIERQRKRLHTLQVAFQEQKKLFGRSNSMM